MERFIVLVFIEMIICLAMGDDYIVARQGFENAQVGLMLGRGKFTAKFNKLKTGVGYLVDEETWKDGEKIVKCDFQKGAFYKMAREREDEKIDKFQIKCCLKNPILFQYGKNTVLSIPVIGNKKADANVCDSFLRGNMLKIVQQLTHELPKKKIKVKLIVSGRSDLDLGMLCLEDVESDRGLQELIHNALSREIVSSWQKKHEAMRQRIPRRPPVVYGKNQGAVIKRIDGTYEIPKEEPTIRGEETVYATGFGSGRTMSGEMVDVTMMMPIGRRKFERKIHQTYDYPKLKAMLLDYQRKVEEYNNDKPPKIDENDVINLAESGKVLFSWW